MIDKKLYAAIGALVFIIGTAFSVQAYFETRAHADEIHERIAGDRETGELRTRLEILDIKLQRYKDLATTRPLSEAEKIDLRSLEAEHAAVINRMAAKS